MVGMGMLMDEKGEEECGRKLVWMGGVPAFISECLFNSLGHLKNANANSQSEFGSGPCTLGEVDINLLPPSTFPSLFLCFAILMSMAIISHVIFDPKVIPIVIHCLQLPQMLRCCRG